MILLVNSKSMRKCRSDAWSCVYVYIGDGGGGGVTIFLEFMWGGHWIFCDAGGGQGNLFSFQLNFASPPPVINNEWSLTEYLTLFWFAMLVNEYKPEFQLRKSSKDAKFWQCLYLRSPLCYEQNRCAERTGHYL